jgi:hypothetical protein
LAPFRQVNNTGLRIIRNGPLAGTPIAAEAA